MGRPAADLWTSRVVKHGCPARRKTQSTGRRVIWNLSRRDDLFVAYRLSCVVERRKMRVLRPKSVETGETYLSANDTPSSPLKKREETKWDPFGSARQDVEFVLASFVHLAASFSYRIPFIISVKTPSIQISYLHKSFCGTHTPLVERSEPDSITLRL